MSARGHGIALGISPQRAFMLAAIALAGALQATDLVVIGSAKANLTLAALAAFAFIVPTFAWYAGLLIVAGFFVRFAPGLDLALLAFVGVCLAIFVASRALVAVPALGAPVLAAAATVVFYLLLDPAFLGAAPVTVFAELFYNALVAAGCYLIAARLGHEQEIRISF